MVFSALFRSIALIVLAFTVGAVAQAETGFKGDSTNLAPFVNGTVNGFKATRSIFGGREIVSVAVGGATSFDAATSMCQNLKAGDTKWELVGRTTFLGLAMVGGGDALLSAQMNQAAAGEREVFAFWTRGENAKEDLYLLHTQKFIQMTGLSDEVLDLGEIIKDIELLIEQHRVVEVEKAKAMLEKLKAFGIPVICVSSNVKE